MHGENNTASDQVTPLDPSDDEADPMVYSSASSAFSGLRQVEFSNTSEDNATEETESMPLRWNNEQESEICTTEATSEPIALRRNGWKK